MARVSMILSTGLLVVWIAVLGSGGSLLEGWKSGPKAVSSPQVFGLLLWSRITMFQRQQQRQQKDIERLEEASGRSSSTVSMDNPNSDPFGLSIEAVEELLPRPVDALAYWTYQGDNKRQQPPLATNIGSDAQWQTNNSSTAIGSDCTEMMVFGSRADSSNHRSQSKRGPEATQTKTAASGTGHNNASPTMATKPTVMSMLLYGSKSRTIADFPRETGAMWKTKDAQYREDTATSLGTVICKCNNNYTAQSLQAMPQPDTGVPLPPHRSATRLVHRDHRTEELSQDANNITSMIAISTVLIFATFVTF